MLSPQQTQPVKEGHNQWENYAAITAPRVDLGQTVNVRAAYDGT